MTDDIWTTYRKIIAYRKWVMDHMDEIVYSVPYNEREYLRTAMFNEKRKTELFLRRMEKVMAIDCVGDITTLAMFDRTPYNESRGYKTYTYIQHPKLL